MFTLQDSSLARNLQFSSVDASLQGLTLSQMTTQHNSTVPRRKNPLKVRLTARILSLRHSKNLVTALDFSTRRRSQPSHKFVFSQSATYTPLHTVPSFYNVTKPAMMATLSGMPSSIQRLVFRRLIGSSSQLSWCDTRVRRMVLWLVSLGYTPSSLAFWPSLGFETRCRGCHSYTAQSRVPAPSPFVCLTVWKCSCAWGSKLRTNFLLEAFDRRRRSLRSSGAYDSCAARQRGQESDTQFTDRK